MSTQELIYGHHTVKAVLKAHADLVQELLVQSSRDEKMLDEICVLAEQHHVVIRRLTRKELDAMFSDKVVHQGVVAVCHTAPSFDEYDLKEMLAEQENALVLILDGVQDPHNLGACLRTANAFGVHCVIAPKDRAVGLTATVRKVACGAASITPFVQVTNLARTMQWLQEQNIWIVGAAGEAEQTIFDLDLKGRIAIVMGGEGEGMRERTQKHCDFLARIPMSGTVTSFNVSVATGVCLYEVVRQRLL